jgi:hypothetical protein
VRVADLISYCASPHCCRELQQLYSEVVNKSLGDDGEETTVRLVSMSTVKRFMREHSLKCRKTSAIDPARAKQGTRKVRDDWFRLVDDYVRELYADGKVPISPSARQLSLSAPHRTTHPALYPCADD